MMTVTPTEQRMMISLTDAANRNKVNNDRA